MSTSSKSKQNINSEPITNLAAWGEEGGIEEEKRGKGREWTKMDKNTNDSDSAVYASLQRTMKKNIQKTRTKRKVSQLNIIQ